MKITILKIFFSFLFIGLLFTALFPLRLYIDEIVADAKNDAVVMLERRLGHRVSYSGIAPSILHAFEIRDFTIFNDENPDMPLLRIERLRLSFNLLKFRPKTPLDSFQGLLIVNSEISFDSSKQEELFSLFESMDSSDGRGSSAVQPFALPDDFFIKGRNIDIRITAGRLNTELTRMFFTIRKSPEKEFVITLKADTETDILNLSENTPLDDLKISTAVSLAGRLDPDFSWAEINIITRKFNSDLLSIDRFGLNLKYEDSGLISVIKTGDSIPADLSFNYDTESNRIDMGLIAQDFTFNRYFSAGPVLQDYSTFLDCTLTGEADFTYFLNDGHFEYAGDLSVRNLKGLIEGAVDADLAVEGTDRSMDIEYAGVSAEPGTADFSGTIVFREGLPLVNGHLNIPRISYAGIDLSSELSLSSSYAEGYSLSSGRTFINGLSIPVLDAQLTPYEKNIEFRLSAGIMTEEKTVDNIYSEGVIQIDEPYIQISADIDNLLISPVLEAVPGNYRLPSFLETFDAEAEIFVSGTPEQLSFASPLISLKDRYNEQRNLTFSLSGNNSGIRLSDLVLNWDENYLKGSLTTNLDDKEKIAVQSNLEFNGTTFNSAGVFSTDGNLSLIGDYGLKFNMYSIGDVLSFNIKTDRIPVNSAETTSFLSLNAAGYFASSSNWKILLNDFSVDDIPTGYGNTEIKLSAYINQSGGNIYNINYSDEKSALSGIGSINLKRILPRPEGLIHLNISSSEQNEKYSLFLDYDGDRLRGDLKLENFPVRRLSEKTPIGGSINSHIAIAGTPESPELRIQAASENAVMNNEQLDFNASLLYSDLILKIENIDGAFGAFQLDDVGGTVNLGSGSHSLRGSISSESKLLTVSTELQLSADTVPVASLIELPAVFSADMNATAVFADLYLNEEEKDPWNFRLQKHNKILNVTGGTGSELEFNLFEDGYFTAAAEAPFPVSLAVSGTVADGNIDALINDIHYVFDELQIPFFVFYEGELKGRLKIQGPLKDPDFFGQLDFYDMVFKPPIVEDITEPFDTSFFFSGREIKLPATRARTNNGLVFVNLTAQIEKWLPRQYDIKVNVPEGEAVSARFYRSPFYVYGFCEGMIRIYGDFGHMKIDGDLLASEGIFMLNNAMDIPSVGSPTEYVSSNLKVTVKENNQFYWPNQDVPIIKGYLSSGNKFNMKHSSTDGLVLDGELALKGGEIFYFERNFYIKEGDIIFNNATMAAMDPLLSARAEIRDINTEGELTKIFLIVDQSPLSSFTPRFESEPPMSTAEILALVGGNIFDSFESDNSSLTDAVLLTTDVLAQFAIMRNIEDGLKSSLGLDLLSIRSSFFSNFIENTFLPGTNTGEASNFARYLDNTTLFLGKYFSDDIFLQGMFQFDLYNDTGYSEEINMNIDSEIKLEWQAPIANVELNFYPDFQDPIEGINKTSLGLSWRFTY